MYLFIAKEKIATFLSFYLAFFWELYNSNSNISVYKIVLVSHKTS